MFNSPIYDYFIYFFKNKFIKLRGNNFLKFLKKLDSTKIPDEQMQQLS